MWWSKTLILGSLAWLFSSSVFAGKVSCPPVLKEGNKTHRMNLVDVFVGPPEERASLLPDTDEKWYGHLRTHRIMRRSITHPYFLFASIREHIKLPL